jgi:outer membrane protein assembly factor BamB
MKWALTILLTILLTIVTSATAEDWPGFRRDPALNGVDLTAKIPANPKPLWEVATADGVSSTPVIVGELVYVGLISGDLLCLKLENGQEVWKYQSLPNAKPNELPPAFSAPIAASDKLIFAGDQEGTLHAIDRQTGQQVWTIDDGGEFVGGPNLYKDRLIFGSHRGKLTCVDQATGKTVYWVFDTEGPINGTPTIAGQYTFSTNCQAPFLKVVDIETGKAAKSIPIEGRLIASAAFRDDILYFGTEIGAVYALDWQKSELTWTYANPDREQQIDSSPAVSDNLVVIGHGDKNLHAIDRKTGQGKWMVPTRAKVDCSPVIAGDKVIFGSNDKQLYLVQLSDGQILWKHNAGQPIRGSAAVSGDRFVIGTEGSGGKVLCFGK